MKPGHHGECTFESRPLFDWLKDVLGLAMMLGLPKLRVMEALDEKKLDPILLSDLGSSGVHVLV